MNKKCTGCNRDLPETSEYFHRKNGGFAARCKECIKAYYNKYYIENHERVKSQKVEQSKVYYDKNKDIINDRRKQQYKEGTSKRKAWSSEYYELNKEELIQKRKEYLRTEEGWAKKVAHDQLRRSKEKALQSNFSAQDWKKCKEYFNDRCAYCGKEKPLTREHFVPLVNGGEFTVNNIIPACKSCNSKKKQSDFFEWYSKQEFFSKQREQQILKYLNYNDNVQQLTLC